MSKGVFVHRADSKYDDFPEEQYQFPKRYLNRARQFDGDWIVYYEPRGGGGRLGYNAVAKIRDIVPDPGQSGMYLALIEPGSYLPFEEFVSYKSHSGFMESYLEKSDGTLNKGLVQWAVRQVSEADFNAILQIGLPDESDLLPRIGEQPEKTDATGFGDANIPYEHEQLRDRVEIRLNRPVRDRVFRKLVLEAYDNRCSITGLRLINGLGRAEVEAAHIWPVSANGPDSIKNGIALSGTVHWMFDRGLISLSDELDILVSRQVNDPNQVETLVNSSGKAIAPADPDHRPHPKYLNWHRENCFKA